MDNGTSLDDILNSEPTQEVEQPPETIGQPRDESGRFAPKDQGEDAEAVEVAAEGAPPAPEQEPGHIPIAALKDERTKRQDAEAKLAQYEQYFNQLQAPQQQEAPQGVELDPETQAFVDLVRQQVTAEVMQNVQQYTTNAGLMERGRVSEMLARTKYQDYDEVVENFKLAAGENQFLLQELMKAEDPAEYAYRAGKQVAEARKYGSTEPVSREQIEAEIREKIMAEIGMSNRPQAPTTLASERSVGSRSGPAWSGPTALGDILG